MSEDRKTVLLKAAYDILKKCDEGPYVVDALGVTAVWDGADCDGYCLMEDIKNELGLDLEERLSS